jgi:hypothetical protein
MGKLRFLPSCVVVVDDILAGSAVNHAMSILERLELLLRRLRGDEGLDRAFHPGFVGLITSPAFLTLPDSFLCVQMMRQSKLL